MNRVRESAHFVAENAVHVKFGNEAAMKSAAEILKGLVSKWKSEGSSQNPLHPNGITPEQRVNWLFLVDTLNFAFWQPPGQPLCRYRASGPLDWHRQQRFSNLQ